MEAQNSVPCLRSGGAVTRNSDSLDFNEVAVWGVKAALQAVYEAGLAAGKDLNSQR